MTVMLTNVKKYNSKLVSNNKKHQLIKCIAMGMYFKDDRNH